MRHISNLAEKKDKKTCFQNIYYHMWCHLQNSLRSYTKKHLKSATKQATQSLLLKIKISCWSLNCIMQSDNFQVPRESILVFQFEHPRFCVIFELVLVGFMLTGNTFKMLFGVACLNNKHAIVTLCSQKIIDRVSLLSVDSFPTKPKISISISLKGKKLY